MKFQSTMKISKKDVEQLILDHMRSKDTPGITYQSMTFDVTAGGDDGPYGYTAPGLTGVTLNVEIELP